MRPWAKNVDYENQLKKSYFYRPDIFKKWGKWLVFTMLPRYCGKTGIRTLEPRKGLTVFETAPFDHSGIFPKISDFRIQMSEFRFQISEFRCQISDVSFLMSVFSFLRVQS